MESGDSKSIQEQMSQGWRDYEALRLPEALNTFQTVSSLDPGNYEAQLALARTLIRMRRQQEATQAAERCITLRPDRGEGHSALAVILFLDDKLEEAQQHLKRAIELAPEDPEPHLTLAQVYADLKQTALANAELQQARRLVSHIEDDHARRQMEASELHARTYVLLSQNKVADAIASANELTEYEQDNPYAACLAYSNLGLLEARSKHYDQAIAYLQRAYTANPYFYRAGSALGRVLFVKGRANQAAEVLRQVVETMPAADAHTRHAYAAALAKSGNPLEARTQYKAALQAGLKGMEAVVAYWQLVWLSPVGRLIIVSLILLAAAAWVIFGKPTPQVLSFAGVLLILLAMQRLLGRKRYH